MSDTEVVISNLYIYRYTNHAEGLVCQSIYLLRLWKWLIHIHWHLGRETPSIRLRGVFLWEWRIPWLKYYAV